MAQICDICGKGPRFGNNISHAHNITRRRWNVNLQAVKAMVNGAPKKLRVCASCIKSGKSRRLDSLPIRLRRADWERTHFRGSMNPVPKGRGFVVRECE
jgi:large subunit ribosomal protein L28